MADAQTLIQSCVDANSSWAEGVSEMGLLASFDWDLCLEGSLFADFLVEELGITEDKAVAELNRFVCDNWLWTPENLLSYMPDVLRICLENGDPEETVAAVTDYAERYERPDIVEALRAAASGHDYEEEILEALEVER